MDKDDSVIKIKTFEKNWYINILISKIRKKIIQLHNTHIATLKCYDNILMLYSNINKILIMKYQAFCKLKM